VLTHVKATRYVTPLREGGSLPGVMEADDLGTYVVKFTGAGQGRKVLIAEIVCGRLAQALGLPVPELVTVEVAAALGRAEPDQEIQHLLLSSAGVNLGMDFLPGALDFDASHGPVEPTVAGRVLWFDALTGNVDRSWRNPNMLAWSGRPYLIDHGSALTFHHNWPSAAAWAGRDFDCADHVMAGYSPDVDAAHRDLSPLVTEELLDSVIADVPQEWLCDEPGFDEPSQLRRAYQRALRARLAAADNWLPGVRAVTESVSATGGTRPARPTSQRPDWLLAADDRAKR
jgi:hypothetical protein